jgi:choline-glycine betaine transporter
MNLIAIVILAPTLGWFVPNRRHLYIALAAAWLLILPFQTHNVLLGEQADEPLANTLAYFAMNYTILAAGIGIATLVHRRRHPARIVPAQAAATAR